MTLKIKPHAIEQDFGPFIFPELIVKDPSGIGNLFNFVEGTVHVTDQSSGLDSTLTLRGNQVIIQGNAGVELWRNNPTEVVFNEPGNDLDFRVESDNQPNMFFVNAGGDFIEMNAAAAGIQSILYLKNDRDTSQQDGDGMGIVFRGSDSAGNLTNYAQIQGYIEDVTSTTEDGWLLFKGMKSGAVVEYVRLASTTAVFNEGGLDIDFRVETAANPNGLMINAGAERVGIMTDPQRSFHVSSIGPWVARFDGTGSNAYVIEWQNHYPSSASNYIDWRFMFFNSAAVQEVFANIRIDPTDVTDGSEDCRLEFQTQVAGTRAARWFIGNGFFAPVATGGDKGAGTINVSGDVYKNNSAYTNPDYVLEHWATGEIMKFKDNPGAKDYRSMTLGEVEDYAREHLHLPYINREPSGVFDRGDAALLWLERIVTYLIDHEDRLAQVEH